VSINSQPGLQSECQDSQGYTEKPCLKKKKKEEEEEEEECYIFFKKENSLGQ
jgi:hypothetical protein